MGVDFQIPKASSICIFLDQYADRESREWFAAFRKEQKSRVRLHLVPSFKPHIHSAHFAVVHWLSGGVPVLYAMNMDNLLDDMKTLAREIEARELKLDSGQPPKRQELTRRCFSASSFSNSRSTSSSKSVVVCSALL